MDPEVYALKPFSSSTKFVGKATSQTKIIYRTRKVLTLGKLWSHSQTLDLAGKACQGQTLLLITNIKELRP